jgi:hypothetical protein
MGKRYEKPSIDVTKVEMGVFGRYDDVINDSIPLIGGLLDPPPGSRRP